MIVLNRVDFWPILVLIAGLCLPVTLHGQTEKPTSSIVVQTIVKYVFDNKSIAGTFELSVPNAEVTLVAEGDTLRTQGGSGGIFTCSGISARSVTLSVVVPERQYSISGSFELMPGENIVLVPMPGVPNPPGFSMQPSEEPLFEMDGDTWTYHYPTIYNNLVADSRNQQRPPDESLLLVNKLKDLPGVEFNKRRNTITISGPAVHKTFVNGAYIFALNPEASE